MKLLLVDMKKVSKRAAQLGIVLALVCRLLPDDYKIVCSALLQLCTLGGP